MKIVPVLAAAVVSLAGLAAGAATYTYDINGSGGWKDASRWVGTGVPGTGDKVIIPAGANAVVATVEDNEVYSAVSYFQLDEGSTTTVSYAEAPQPVRGWRYLTGGGTIVKATPAKWAMANDVASFYGDWVIEKGQFVAANKNYADCRMFGETGGSYANPPRGRIIICAGACLDCSDFSMPEECTLGWKEIRIAGKFSDTFGAIDCAGYKNAVPQWYRNVVLDDDAYVSAINNVFAITGESVENPGILDLHGHDLYHLRPGNSFGLLFANVIITNSVPASGGRIFVGNSAYTYHSINIGAGVMIDPSVKIVVDKLCKVVYGEGGELPLPLAAAFKTTSSTDPIGVIPSVFPREATNAVRWVGDVETAAGSPLAFAMTNGAMRVTVAGKVSGAGGVKTEVSSSGQLVLANAANDFTGPLNVLGVTTHGSIKVEHPGSVPAAASVSVDGSTLIASMANWSFSQYLALLNRATLTNTRAGDNPAYVASVTMDPEGCENDTVGVSFQAGDIQDLAKAVGVAGKGTVVVTELPEDERIRLAAYEGTLKLSGEKTFKTGTLLATGFADGATEGEVIFDGATVDLGGNAAFVGAPNAAVNPTVRGSLALRGATVTGQAAAADGERLGLQVGAYGQGRLTVESGTQVSATVLQMGSDAKGIGEVIQNGGTMNVLNGLESTDNGYPCVKIGYSGHGYYEINGGELGAKGFSLAQCGNASGVIRINDGTVNAETYLFLGYQRSNTGISVSQVYNCGGTGICGHTCQLAPMSWYGNGTVATLTLDGASAKQTASVFFGMGLAAGSTAILNLNNGGTLEVPFIYGAGNTSSQIGSSYVNFDGGRFHRMGWGSSATIFGEIEKAEGATTWYAPVTRVTVYPKGGELLIEKSGARRLDRPLDGPTGNGVASVDWTDTTGVYPACPAVYITGEGFGASAVADYDSATRRIRKIIVTSPGCDYKEGTTVAHLKWGSTVQDVPCTLAENRNVGGMTFRNEDNGSYVYFGAANTYGGPTVLGATTDGLGHGGHFVISNAAAFAASSSITFAGGEADLCDHTLADLGTDLKFMGGVVKGDAPTYAIPEGKMVIDMDDVLAGHPSTLANNANLTLPSSVRLLNVDVAKLDPERKGGYALLILPANYSGTVPTFVGVPTDWHVSRVADTFKLKKDRGGLLILR